MKTSNAHDDRISSDRFELHDRRPVFDAPEMLRRFEGEAQRAAASISLQIFDTFAKKWVELSATNRLDFLLADGGSALALRASPVDTNVLTQYTNLLRKRIEDLLPMKRSGNSTA